MSFRPKTTYRQHNTGIRDGTYGPCSIQDGRATPQHNVCLSGSHHSQRLRHQGQSCVSPLLTVPTTVSNCDCLSASSKSTTQGELDLPGLWILNYIRKLFYDAWLPQGINISKQCNPLVARSPALSCLLSPSRRRHKQPARERDVAQGLMERPVLPLPSNISKVRENATSLPKLFVRCIHSKRTWLLPLLPSLGSAGVAAALMEQL